MPFDDVPLNDGNKMPAIAFGTGSKWKGQDVSKYISEAIQVGFSHIDTAQFYTNEESVALAIRQSGLGRSEFFITTKWSAERGARESLEISLAKLNLKYVDLYLIHNPVFVKDIEGAWAEFEKIKEDGLAKSIGISNFNLELTQKVVKFAKIKPAVNQIYFHPYNYYEHKGLLEYSAQHGIIVEAYSSLSPITKYPGGPVDKPLEAAAHRIGATTTQVVQAWVKSKGVVIVTTSSNPEHMREYLAVGDLPPLTEEEITAIDEAGAKGPPSLAYRVQCTFLLLSAAVLVFRLSYSWF